MFAVLEIEQSYEDIVDIQCIKTFDSEEEADKFIQETKNAWNEKFHERHKYIDDFVDNMIVPEHKNYSEWTEYLKQFPFGTYVVPKDFRKSLNSLMKKGYSVVNVEGYNPPVVPPYRQYFSIKINL